VQDFASPNRCYLAIAGAGPTDVRMTTRFKEEDLTEGLTGAIHETGHALYEQGRNLAYDGLPVNAVWHMLWDGEHSFSTFIVLGGHTGHKTAHILINLHVKSST
jgi:hypothetical protein